MRFLEKVFAFFEEVKDLFFALLLIGGFIVFLLSSFSFFFDGEALYGFIDLFLMFMTGLFIKPAVTDVFTKEEN
ncbi:hypothetical protein [Bacillus suaedaesalsae]|uniref:Uncharacterized protein n=1 Tax=Bacillus suaedaesalsae TaxID=2810349 RepID=A0ABS2DGE5_9BACI|nr:hypothetical protein [Bacillus suaedaesalsae]MBM6616618.1 hypothetical protein [Bacillus suaedaesalsae]